MVSFSQENQKKNKRLDGEEGADDGLSMEVEFKRVPTEILDRLCMKLKERFQRLKEYVGRFGFLLDTDLLLRAMDEETRLKHSADFASFCDEIQSKQLLNESLIHESFFIIKRYQRMC